MAVRRAMRGVRSRRRVREHSDAVAYAALDFAAARRAPPFEGFFRVNEAELP